MNNSSFIGNLCKDAVQQRQSQRTGTNYITFDIAVNTLKDRPPLYVSCIRTGDNAKILPYLLKGKKVYVRGSISAHAYIGSSDNQPHANLDLNVFELELLSGGGSATNEATHEPHPMQAAPTPTTAPQSPSNPFPPSDADNLPF